MFINLKKMKRTASRNIFEVSNQNKKIYGHFENKGFLDKMLVSIRVYASKLGTIKLKLKTDIETSTIHHLFLSSKPCTAFLFLPQIPPFCNYRERIEAIQIVQGFSNLIVSTIKYLMQSQQSTGHQRDHSIIKYTL